MKLGVHAYTWCSQWSNETLGLIDKVKENGLDFLEIPLMCLDKFDPSAVKKRANSVGIDLSTATVLLGETDITSDDSDIRKKGVDYLKKCIDATSSIESNCFSGVIYSQHLKPAVGPPTEDTWKYSADALREIALYASKSGIDIGLEPVTRYDSYLLNTCEQALKLINLIGEENVKVHLDSYHMNVEEKSFYEATKAAGDKLIHYHLCENDRGIPGTGLVNWDDIFRALSEIGYSGRVGLEGLSDVKDNMPIFVWRKLAPDGDTFLREGLKFIRSKIKEYNLE